MQMYQIKESTFQSRDKYIVKEIKQIALWDICTTLDAISTIFVSHKFILHNQYGIILCGQITMNKFLIPFKNVIYK